MVKAKIEIPLDEWDHLFGQIVLAKTDSEFATNVYDTASGMDEEYHPRPGPESES